MPIETPAPDSIFAKVCAYSRQLGGLNTASIRSQKAEQTYCRAQVLTSRLITRV